MKFVTLYYRGEQPTIEALQYLEQFYHCEISEVAYDMDGVKALNVYRDNARKTLAKNVARALGLTLIEIA